jgi:ABC-2 type transport system ATP-binding protein
MTTVRSESSEALRTEKFTKKYGAQYALDGVDLVVPRGAIGLLGPNGAGKSTLMKSLLQLIPVDYGEAWILGQSLSKSGKDTRMRIGYMPEQDCHIPGMVGCEYVTYCAQLCGLDFQSARQRAHEMLDFVGMGQERYRKIDTYSTGMKQRLKLAQALAHDPELLFLDEPTNGLDPRGRAQILDLIQDLWKTHGITVVLSSHLLQDVDRICEQIIIISQGKLLVHDKLENLKKRKQGVAEIALAGKFEPVFQACADRGWKAFELPNGRVRIEHGDADMQSLIQLLKEKEAVILEIIPSPNALEELFLQALDIAADQNREASLASFK